MQTSLVTEKDVRNEDLWEHSGTLGEIASELRGGGKEIWNDNHQKHLPPATLRPTFHESVSPANTHSRLDFLQRPSLRRDESKGKPGTDQIRPSTVICVSNLPLNTSEDELITLFSKLRGYKSLSLGTKDGGPACFVEFKDSSVATKALNILSGRMLRDSTKDGIKTDYSGNLFSAVSVEAPTYLVIPSVPKSGIQVSGLGLSSQGQSYHYPMQLQEDDLYDVEDEADWGCVDPNGPYY